jgi:hypothetical protein
MPLLGGAEESEACRSSVGTFGTAKRRRVRHERPFLGFGEKKTRTANQDYKVGLGCF